MPSAVTPPARSAVPAPRLPGLPGASPAGAGRDPFFDNAKYLAIVLVGLGHAWEPLTHSSRAALALYLTVYAFHMPAFILISGYFSRDFDLSPAKVKRLVTGVAVPYLVFEVAYTYFQHWAEDAPPEPITLLNPWYLNWFLAALFVWRLTTPIWQNLRWAIPVSFAIAILAALSPEIGNDLDLQRVLQFLPFFVIGLHLEPHHFKLVQRRGLRIAAVPVFASAIAVAYWAAPRMNSSWFYHNDSVQELAAPLWAAPVMQLAMFACAAVLIVCFLAWVPRRTVWFTALGAGTLYGFLLHGFLIKLSRWWEWYDAYAWIREPVGGVVVTLLAAVGMTALCTAPVRRVFRFAVEPRMEWAFRKRP
ncbi:membrane protein [Streptomyces eurocidicus]|uniref:Fucose 4-O-acetylase-like acetyltransferase n=1 Tax=Streptomyces eurocidicus TaxID=66423 RepID=A0A2N8P2U9_STREU|nr:acyltransferase family protein [Streptomyces eurocidicus]MBB5117505.1 fucose 4-O-acetylase-like acetyltransferase [Streptomyces eurocidicus]MBF6053347.1 acyltransferase family protein [Streptomyces eurocidicus]PNE35346.1 membrane protein [Streptomyces eurocidicus]